jgi:Ser/Thr protein kinase RdoA (MazF antagonist)
MDADRPPSRRQDLARLRQAGRQALAQFGIDRATLRLLRHEHNTTFRVDTDRASFVLRIHRPDGHAPETVASELAWLRALGNDSDLGVPQPVATLSGTPLAIVTNAAGTGSLSAVLLRWQPGRLVDQRLAPRHLCQLATLQAGLQLHAARWSPGSDFVRPHVDTLTSEARAASVGSSPSPAGRRPTTDDAESAIAVVGDLLSTADAAVIDRALGIVWATTDQLQQDPAAQGLIHADLHYENVLFDHGSARAIDFDDCGWGFRLYDLAVTLWELEDRPRYPALRDALLDEYARHLALPEDLELHLRALALLRRMQILMWILESRDHAAFRDNWRQWATDEISGITRAMKTF